MPKSQIDRFRTSRVHSRPMWRDDWWAFPYFFTIFLGLAVIAGCAVIDRWSGTAESPGSNPASQLPPIVPSRNAIQLEIVFVDRPVDDPLLGDSLWRDVDQVTALPVLLRAKLKQYGFRVGQTGSTPPAALQSSLGLTSQPQCDDDSDGSNRFTVRRVALPSGGETEIEVSPVLPERDITIPGTKVDQSRHFQNSRCVLRVRAHRVQDGWANIEFIPEIHHGWSLPRATAARTGWQFRTTQTTEPLFGLRFDLDLALHEMVVVTADSEEPDMPGYQFFRGADESAFGQRLLLVRLADMCNVQPVYSE